MRIESHRIRFSSLQAQCPAEPGHCAFWRGNVVRTRRRFFPTQLTRVRRAKCPRRSSPRDYGPVELRRLNSSSCPRAGAERVLASRGHEHTHSRCIRQCQAPEKVREPGVAAGLSRGFRDVSLPSGPRSERGVRATARLRRARRGSGSAPARRAGTTRGRGCLTRRSRPTTPRWS